MNRRMLSAALLAVFTLSALPASARPDDERRGRGGERDRWEDRRDDRRDDRREDRKEDRKYWKERDKSERKYWKERDKEARKHERHRYEYEDHDRGRHYRAPAWMDGYWRPGEGRRYVALVPGDPSRVYVFVDGRWVLRQVRDPRARLDLEGAFQLPMAPPPVAPPRLGVDLHVVLFN